MAGRWPRKRADSMGGVVFRGVAPGKGYRMRQGGARSATADRFHRPSGAAEHQDLRPDDPDQRLRLPDAPATAPSSRSTSTCRAAPARIRRWSSTPATATPTRPGPESGIGQIANLLGFAVVDVNMRGTGCSGGSFNYFEPLQGLDGYDVIETVAHQPWVLHHKVGMLGISYGGISQLFVGCHRSARPGRDRAAVGDRHHRDDVVPGRDPQHRLRALLGRAARSTTRCRPRRPAASRGR